MEPLLRGHWMAHWLPTWPDWKTDALAVNVALPVAAEEAMVVAVMFWSRTGGYFHLTTASVQLSSATRVSLRGAWLACARYMMSLTWTYCSSRSSLSWYGLAISKGEPPESTGPLLPQTRMYWWPNSKTKRVVTEKLNPIKRHCRSSFLALPRYSVPARR